MKKKRVLFVDDEPNILDGLRRMLRSMRKEFEMKFADNAAKALLMMENEEYEIVVSDMRMPGMDGAEFLTKVKQKYPQSIRLMLTGQADDESVMRAVPVVHQFLAKPCDPDKLKRVIQRSSNYYNLLTNGNIKDLISGITTLPSIPSLYFDLQEILNDPDAEISQIGKLIEQDIAMTAKILQLVNSAFFGFYQKVDSPARAVTLLGTETIKSLVVGIGIFSDNLDKKQADQIDNLWQHSLMVSNAAKKIAAEECEDNDLINDSYLSGLLHDIGKLILLSNMKEDYEKAQSISLEHKKTSYEAENMIFQANHSEMGAYLLGLWGFHHRVIEAVGFHHQLSRYPTSEFSPAHAVHVSDVFCHKFVNKGSDAINPQLDLANLNEIGLQHKVEKWETLAFEVFTDYS